MSCVCAVLMSVSPQVEKVLFEITKGVLDCACVLVRQPHSLVCQSQQASSARLLLSVMPAWRCRSYRWWHILDCIQVYSCAQVEDGEAEADASDLQARLAGLKAL